MPNPSAPRPDLDVLRQAVLDAAADFADAKVDEAESDDSLGAEGCAIALNEALDALIAGCRDRRTYCTVCGERVTMDATLRDLYGDLCDAHAHDRAYEARMTQGE